MRRVIGIGVVVAALGWAGCGGGPSVDQRFSDKVGQQVTGCKEVDSDSQRTVYQCDDGASGIILANGKVQVNFTVTGANPAHGDEASGSQQPSE
jgi:hypothetical protein